MSVKTIEMDPTSVGVTWTDKARQTLADMTNRVAVLASAYGEDSPQATKAALSFVRVMRSLHGGWGDVVVTWDSDLSLFCSSESIVFGLIWHPVRRRCTREGCKAMINDDGAAWTYMPDYPKCDDHIPSYPLDAPHPGEWSFHS